MLDMSESRVPADFAVILADERAPLIVGGQAINLWAEVYVGRCPALDGFVPFVSRDADIFGTPQMAEELARKAGWHCRFINARDAITVAVLTSRTLGNEPPLVVEVLGEVNGLNSDDLALDTVIEVAEGRRYRVPSPPVLLKAKLYNLVSLANLDRPQDIRHVRMLLRLMPLYLGDLTVEHQEGRLTQEELLAALHYTGGVIVAPFAGNAARAYDLDLADVFSMEALEILPAELKDTIQHFIREARQLKGH
jgi:hypothetical protein